MKLFSFILSDAYCINSWNCSLVRTFLARARISRQISLKTRSAHPIFASSINSLHAENKTSFKGHFHIHFCGVSLPFLTGF